METETKVCQNCKKDFTIEIEDFNFYEKMKVPPPTFCPYCRMIRRMAFGNLNKFYKRPCDKCGVEIRTPYASDRPEIVYCVKCYQQEFA